MASASTLLQCILIAYIAFPFNCANIRAYKTKKISHILVAVRISFCLNLKSRDLFIVSHNYTFPLRALLFICVVKGCKGGFLVDPSMLWKLSCIRNACSWDNCFFVILNEPTHAIMALIALRKFILQIRMRSNPVSLGSPEPSLVAYVISTIISWVGSY